MGNLLRRVNLGNSSINGARKNKKVLSVVSWLKKIVRVPLSKKHLIHNNPI